VAFLFAVRNKSLNKVNFEMSEFNGLLVFMIASAGRPTWSEAKILPVAAEMKLLVGIGRDVLLESSHLLGKILHQQSRKDGRALDPLIPNRECQSHRQLRSDQSQNP
jgi:hypothetical protein